MTNSIKSLRESKLLCPRAMIPEPCKLHFRNGPRNVGAGTSDKSAQMPPQLIRKTVRMLTGVKKTGVQFFPINTTSNCSKMILENDQPAGHSKKTNAN